MPWCRYAGTTYTSSRMAILPAHVEKTTLNTAKPTAAGYSIPAQGAGVHGRQPICKVVNAGKLTTIAIPTYVCVERTSLQDLVGIGYAYALRVRFNVKGIALRCSFLVYGTVFIPLASDSKYSPPDWPPAKENF